MNEKRNIKLPKGYQPPQTPAPPAQDDVFAMLDAMPTPAVPPVPMEGLRDALGQEGSVDFTDTWDDLPPEEDAEETPLACAQADESDADDAYEQIEQEAVALRAAQQEKLEQKQQRKQARAEKRVQKRAVKNARPKKKHPFLRRMAMAVVLCCILGGAGIAFYLKQEMQYDFLWLDLAQLPYKDATVLYAQNTATGEWEEYTRLEATQQKIWVDLEQIPLQLQQAFVAIEDQHFYKHNGVSWTRTAYAILNELKHAVTGTYFGGEDGMKQGASTITQQLIKNLTRDEGANGLQGYLRKVREITRALTLDATYEKDQILEAYLNIISFTGNTAGVQAESMKLFNKTVDQLSLEQCASIAAITKNPTRYDPTRNPDIHITRRNYILYEMWQQEYITEEEYLAASACEIGLRAGKVDVPPTELTTYFTDAVIESVTTDLIAKYGLTRAETTNLLYNGGLRIYLTVDTALQSAMENTMQNVWNFPRPGVATTAYVYDENGKLVLDESGNPVRENITEYPQAAMVSLGYDGALKAVVGGLGPKEISRGLNRATTSLRQVGSTMKPIGAYALALETDKINWSTPFLDAPVRQLKDEATGERKDWPANFSKTYSQTDILAADALAQSINTVAVRVGERAGIRRIFNFVTSKLGITGFTQEDKAAGPMILGSSTYGVTPYQLAASYMMFGSGGTYTTPHCYTSVQNGYGTVWLEPEIATTQAISPDTAYIMNRMLRGVMTGYGTAAGYSVGGSMDSIGKTGTSSDNRDFWFVGLTPYYVTATWYGYDSGFSLNVNGGTGAPTAAWQTVMRNAQSRLPALEFPVDESVKSAAYCTQTGNLATPNCPSATGYYKADGLPAQCRLHAA